jgi:hypothetical protein
MMSKKQLKLAAICGAISLAGGLSVTLPVLACNPSMPGSEGIMPGVTNEQIIACYEKNSCNIHTISYGDCLKQAIYNNQKVVQAGKAASDLANKKNGTVPPPSTIPAQPYTVSSFLAAYPPKTPFPSAIIAQQWGGACTKTFCSATTPCDPGFYETAPWKAYAANLKKAYDQCLSISKGATKSYKN